MRICHHTYWNQPMRRGWRPAELGRKQSFKEDAAFWVIAGFDHSVIAIKIASEVKMRNQIKEFLSWR
jgi:hypothetical protein